jgi:Ulp1 family protease
VWSVEATLRCHFFSTFFYPKLAKTADGPYVYNNVQRWTRRLELSIFAFDLVLLPIHVHDSHWCLVNIDMRTKTLRYWDSLRAGTDEGCLQVCGARALFLSLVRSLTRSLSRSHAIAHSLSP